MNLVLADWANISTIVTAIVALLALVGAVWQVMVSRRSQREATASGLYGDYLALAVQYPRLASACCEGARKNRSTRDEFESYEWFISLMLNAFEQILDLTEGDMIWRKAITDQITYHRDYISSKGFVRGHYSSSLQELFAELTR